MAGILLCGSYDGTVTAVDPLAGDHGKMPRAAASPGGVALPTPPIGSDPRWVELPAACEAVVRVRVHTS
jgi:hypothetical protein